MVQIGHILFFAAPKPDGAPDSLRIKRFPPAGALGALSAKAPKELSGALPTELIRQSKLRSLRFRFQPAACAKTAHRFVAFPLKIEPASPGFDFVQRELSDKLRFLRFRIRPAACAKTAHRFGMLRSCSVRNVH